jgi:hypothetical protein
VELEDEEEAAVVEVVVDCSVVVVLFEVVVVVGASVVVVVVSRVVVVGCAHADSQGAKTVRAAARNPRTSTAGASLRAEGCMKGSLETTTGGGTDRPGGPGAVRIYP